MKALQKTTAHAFGKIILSGEHAGVYGQPMIAGPVGKKVMVTVENKPKTSSRSLEKLARKTNTSLAQLLTIFSMETGIDGAEIERLSLYITGTLPRKAGLGSSAAYAHAVFKALLEYFSLTRTADELFNLVQQSEKIFHGNPSGVDAAVTTSGKFLIFQKNTDGTFQKKPLSQTAQNTLQNAGLFAVYSGPASESTKEMVGNVAQLLAQSPEKEKTIVAIGRVTTEILKALENDVFPLEYIKENHRLLSKLAVVGPTAQKMIHKIEAIGGVGKITGAGGRKKGSGYLLAAHSEPKKLAAFLRAQKWKFFPAFEKL